MADTRQKLVGEAALTAIASAIKSDIDTKADAEATAQALSEKASTEYVNEGLATKASETEVSDIRVGADGTTYPSAGDAVRDQFDAQGGRISAIENDATYIVGVAWERGSINSSGNNSAATNRGRCSYITLLKGEDLIVTPNSYYCKYYKYKVDGTFVGESSFGGGWKNDQFTVTNEDSDYKYRLVCRNPVSSSDVVVANIDIVVNIKSVNTKTMEVLKKTAISDIAWSWVLPYGFHWCGGKELNIYFQNLIIGKRVESFLDIRTSLTFTDYDKFTRYKPNTGTSASNKGVKLQFYPENDTSLISSDTLHYDIIPNSSGSGLTKKVLMIGDSITYNNNQISKNLVNMFSEDVMNIELLGTLGSGLYKHEGRPGWSALDYVSGATVEGSSMTNAFWNPVSQKFDFSYYMTQQSYTNVDYVFINLGTNDTGDPDAYGSAVAEIIESIKAYNSNIKIGVWLCPPRSYLGNGSLVDSIRPIRICQKAIDLFDRQETSKIYLVPVYFNVDPYHDFPYEEVPVSADNSDFTMLVATDKVHPALPGYQKIADVIYCYIKYFGSLDA